MSHAALHVPCACACEARSLLLGNLLGRRLLHHLGCRRRSGRLLVLDAEEGLDAGDRVVGLLEVREEILEELT